MKDLTTSNRYCPACGKQTLRFIEECESSEDELKTSWTCDNPACESLIIYITQFKDTI